MHTVIDDFLAIYLDCLPCVPLLDDAFGRLGNPVARAAAEGVKKCG